MKMTAAVEEVMETMLVLSGRKLLRQTERHLRDV